MNARDERELFEELIEQEEIYNGRIFRCQQGTVRLADGRLSSREWLHHPGGSAVLAIDEDDQILLVRQYRLATSQVLWELPAGKADRLEDPEALARRELSEETGCEADDWSFLGSFYLSPGYSDERLFLYRASSLHLGQQHLDPGEHLHCLKVSFAEAQAMLARGEIVDAKTALAINCEALRREEKRCRTV